MATVTQNVSDGCWGGARRVNAASVGCSALLCTAWTGVPTNTPLLDAGPYLVCMCGQAAQEVIGFDNDGNDFEGIRYLSPEEVAGLERS